jgi:demethylmenaquinone methyltransferase/2-methoxy-6-polyprenyl-1,4-benzoquinol methylase
MSKRQYTYFEFGGRFVKGYDAFNHAASLGLDLMWRASTARLMRKRLRQTKGPFILDLACGTGDMIFAVQKAIPQALTVGTDPSADMLRLGQEKKVARSSPGQLVRAVSRLPFRDETFHAVTCAFGARNFVHLQDDLKELYRLLKPGGTIYILDFYVPENRFARGLLLVYNFLVFPFLGFLLTGRIGPYRYLYKSIFRFRTARDFMSLALQTGYGGVEKRRFFFGLTHVIQAHKIP